jgi:hypothetical protein
MFYPLTIPSPVFILKYTKNYLLVLVEKPAGQIQSRTTLIETLSNGSVSEGLNGFVFIGSVQVLDVFIFKARVKDDFLDKLEELIFVSFETRDTQHNIDRILGAKGSGRIKSGSELSEFGAEVFVAVGFSGDAFVEKEVPEGEFVVDVDVEVFEAEDKAVKVDFVFDRHVDIPQSAVGSLAVFYHCRDDTFSGDQVS